tara:strand:- start:637 stop:4164 length:3528 start_codon:yes stop_codon:yes gene_type:complete
MIKIYVTFFINKTFYRFNLLLSDKFLHLLRLNNLKTPNIMKSKLPTLAKLFLYSILFTLSIKGLHAQVAPGGVSTNLEIWLKADAGFTPNGDSDTEWLDQSPNGIVLNSSLVDGGVDRAPSLENISLNFNPAIAFGKNGRNDDGLATEDNAADWGFSEWSVFSIQKGPRNTRSESGTVWHYDTDGRNDLALYIFNSPATGFGMEVDETPNDFSSPSLDDDLTHLFNFNANSADAQIFVDGALEHTLGGQPTLRPSGAFLVGLDADNSEAEDGNNHYWGNIGEILVFSQKLTVLDQQKVQSYLALKYGLSLNQTVATNYLNSSGTVIWDATINASYKTDIFGIGEDTNSALNQKVARSVNDANGPILATTQNFMEANNDALRTTSLGDGNFIIMGHDNAANTFSASYNGGSNNRLSRVWKVDETGTVGNMYFAVPYASFTFPSGGAPAIVISNNTTFDNTDTLVPLTYSRTEGVYFAQINPADGDYITLATSKISVTTPAYYRGSSGGGGGTSTDGVTSYSNYADFIANTNGVYTAFSQLWSFGDSFFADGIYFYRTNNVINQITRYPSIADLGANTNGIVFNLSQTWSVNDEFFASGDQFFRTNSSGSGTPALTVYPSFADLVANTNGVGSGNFSVEYAFADQFFNDGQYFCRTSVSGGNHVNVQRYESLPDLVAGTVFDTQAFGPWSTNDDIYAVGITASFTVSETALTVDENAGTDTFTVVLDAQPSSNVVFDISSDDTNEATVDKATVTFTTANWNMAQTVTVTGIDDAVTTNDVATIIISINDASSDNTFDSLADKTVAVTLTNDDAQFTITDIINTTVAENAVYTSVTPTTTGDTPFGALTYTLGGVDAGDFTIDSDTGIVSMIARDFEIPVDDNTDNIYILTITATDTNNNSDSEDWTVEVTDVVEAASFTIDAIADTTVAENTAYTSVTPAITGTPIGTVSYALSGTDAGDFTIDSATGVVSMVAQNFEAPADDNANNVYELIITVTDSDGNSDSEDWTVEVTDDNGAEVLAQIGLEGDNPDNTNSTVTVVQLNTITGLTGVVPTNETAYQDYIDANPDSFSSPATLAEVQAMINVVNASLGNETFDSFTFSMYPNPASSMVYLTFSKAESGFANIKIYNTIGQSVFTARKEIRNNKIALDVSSLPTSTYFLNIKNESQVISKKLVIN